MRLAARGARDLDGGEERVRDPEEARLLHARARRIHRQSLVAAALLTGVSVLAVGLAALASTPGRS